MNVPARTQNATPASLTDSTLSLPPRVAHLIGANGPLEMDGNFRPMDRTSLPPVSLADTDLRACEDALRRVNAAMQPAERNELLLELTKLSAHFPANRTEQQWRVVIEDYLAELAAYPRTAVLEAIRQHKRTGQYFPQLRELLAMCEPEKARLQGIRRRLQTLLQSHKTGEKPFAPANAVPLRSLGSVLGVPAKKAVETAQETQSVREQQDAEREEALRLGNGDLAAGYLKMMEQA